MKRRDLFKAAILTPFIRVEKVIPKTGKKESVETINCVDDLGCPPGFNCVDNKAVRVGYWSPNGALK